MIFGTPSDWTSGGAALLKQFLSTPTGQQFLAHLAAYEPSLSNSSDLPTVALAAKEAAGYRKALENILNLSEPVPDKRESTSAETYPDLDDDKLWSTTPIQK